MLSQVPTPGSKMVGQKMGQIGTPTIVIWKGSEWRVFLREGSSIQNIALIEPQSSQIVPRCLQFLILLLRKLSFCMSDLGHEQRRKINQHQEQECGFWSKTASVGISPLPHPSCVTLGKYLTSLWFSYLNSKAGKKMIPTLQIVVSI